MAKIILNVRVALGACILLIGGLQIMSLFRISVVTLESSDKSWWPTPQSIRNKNFGPMLDLLTLAGETVDDKTKRMLPDWPTVTKVIGASEPIILGLQHCPSLDKEETILAVAGMFNSGTNNLYQLLKLNCDIPSSKYLNKFGNPMVRVRWQTPWGKHRPAESRDEIDATTKQPNPTYLDSAWDPQSIFPVVSIRDPYTWMQSMCRKKYNSDWFYTDAHCPNLVPNLIDRQIYRRTKKRTFVTNPNYPSDKIKVRGGERDDTGFHLESESTPVKVRYNTFNITYDSLAHLWNEWYQSYITADFPYLLIRAEDLIFFPEQVTQQVCECAGGTMNENFLLVQEDLKKNDKIGIRGSRDMGSMLIRYGSGRMRTHQMTKEDFEYANKHLDGDLMKLTNYSHPEKLEVVPPKAPPQFQTPPKKVLPLIKSKRHQPLIDLLYQAGESVDKETLKILPSWDEVTSVIGSTKPIIHGLEQCPTFDKREMILAVAGMFNSGTNNLYQLLFKNCELRSSKYINAKWNEPQIRVRWQTPWGKHEVAQKRNWIHSNTTRPNQSYLDDNWDPEMILPVVTIRDPYTWMQSMCRKGYRAEWFYTDAHCPNLVPNIIDRQIYRRTKSRTFVTNPNFKTDKIKVQSGQHDDTGFRPDRENVPVKVRYNSFNTTYDSLAHLWSEWYQGYMDSGAPFLLIRAEDLIFFPEQVVKQVCECVGGKMEDKFSLVQEDLKSNSNHNMRSTESRDMTSMFARYGSGSKRTKQMTNDDLAFAKKHLNGSLMKTNAYKHPEKLEDQPHNEISKASPEPSLFGSVFSAMNVFTAFSKKVVPPMKSKSHQPLIDLLTLAGEPVDQSTLKILPSWSTVTAVIGSTEPKILGLDQCSSFDKAETILAVGGLFNTESNKLFELLRMNCEIESKQHKRFRLRFGFPWGKHEPAEMRDKSSSHYTDNEWSLDTILPVVAVRDPYTWMQSICTLPALQPGLVTWFSTDQHCPNLVPSETDAKVFQRMKSRTFIKNPNKRGDSIKVLYGAWDDAGFRPESDHVPIKVNYNNHSVIYNSIIQIWNDWYRSYWNADFPGLFVRAEDLMFFPQQVTQKVCECAGGKMKENFSLVKKKKKEKEGAGKEHSHDLTNLMIKYGSGTMRTRQLTEHDLTYAKQHVDSDLMLAFGYEHPERLEVVLPTAPIPLKIPHKPGPPKPRSKKLIPKLTVSTVDKEPLIDLLRDAGERVTDADVERLPTWTQVTSLIGDSPKILGLEQCSSFDKSEAILAIAGMLNTGTNLLYSLLHENCDIFSSVFSDSLGYAKERVRWQVNWGKHELPMFRESRDVFTDNSYDIDDVIPVVTTRDPYSWMQSMCRKPYVAAWFFTDKHCPNLILTQEDRETFAKYQEWSDQHNAAESPRDWITTYETSNDFVVGEPRMVGGLHVKYVAPLPTEDTVPVTMHYNSVNMTFTSLPELWNAFYRAYIADDHPAILLRVEDLIFFPKDVTKAICECAGGKIHDMDNFNYITKALKGDTAEAKYSMVDLLVRYGSAEKRTTQMTREDLAHAKETIDTDLMDLYGYNHPI